MCQYSWDYTINHNENDMKMKNKSHRYDLSRSRFRHVHKYSKYRTCLTTPKQHLKLSSWKSPATKKALLISKKRVISFLKGISQFRVRSHERRNELIPFWDFKPAWKQVLLTWSFISGAFQNDPIFWWICLGISFRVVLTWYFITRNEISFLSKWPRWNPYLHWASNAHAH